MAEYGRDYGRRERGGERSPGWTGGGAYPGRDYRTEGYFQRPRRYERGLEIGPTWGGGSDIRYGVHPTGPRGYDRGFRERSIRRAGGHDGGQRPPRRVPPLRYGWQYW